ncbi:MAG: bifunctional UDP-N-acetylglucosamine pyrophosphorylase / Glucosamine-1-phosphate N-acetyltransferase [Parcubacteria group bacterium Gr01-1014_38]|nr:MAG: bifunctional UDP-N-acetylglucosamine pyrophosphorylase / Glucosamine-1-phosphate N-acetyltransferase [Parcubacteria group bacterium Gr01-1014_38]
MQAVVLAGGLGKRLRPVTETVPKPLVPVLGRPVVEYTLEQLPSEIAEVIFVIGYKGEMIREAYGARAFGRTCSYVVQEQPLGTGHAVKHVAPLLRGKFLLLYGDDVYGPEGLRRLVQHDWALLTKAVGHPERFGVLQLRPDGVVEHMVEKPTAFVSDVAWVGAAILQPEFLSVETPLSSRGEYEVTDMVNAMIHRGVPFRTEQADLWLPVNTADDIAAAERALAEARAVNPVKSAD